MITTDDLSRIKRCDGCRLEDINGIYERLEELILYLNLNKRLTLLTLANYFEFTLEMGGHFFSYLLVKQAQRLISLIDKLKQNHKT